ncbi:putative tRNA (uracil-O(2)-)-methyltransferase [Labeo rohita]|uniref:Putative tRNA (Uracil-O(2)-)-methyltransferase n=1 Tax=Labeo rohita TaxID=84645 RepID=A0A498M6M9_LABRO|nr:putative tRNA (uracil-O(2)-)-methyltransferase [Labeo rohita]
MVRSKELSDALRKKIVAAYESDHLTHAATLCFHAAFLTSVGGTNADNVCIIGKGRRYREAEEALVEKRRSDYIRRREALFTSSGVSMNVNKHGHYRPDHNDNGQNISTPVKDWVNGFQPREKTQTIRNCAALPRDFVDAVVLRVAKALLSLTEKNTESSNCGDAWNTGVEGGRVFIRDWRVHTLAQSSRVTSKRRPPPSGALKTRLCWFHTHHPQGCPLPREHCAFAHGEIDLKNPQR